MQTISDHFLAGKNRERNWRHYGSILPPNIYYEWMIFIQLLKFFPASHWSISVKKWQKLFQVKMAPNFTKFEWYQQWKASQGLKNWLKAIKAIKATIQARYEKKLNFHNFSTWLWLFGPKNSCGALGLTKKVHKGQKGHYKARS